MRLWKEPCCVRGIGCASQRSSLTRQRKRTCAESYERDLRDVLALQSELAQAIAREVQVKLTPQERAHFALVHPVDPEAYEAFLKGRYHWNRRSREGLGKAVQYFQQAIAKDSTYAA